ncbi:MAG: tRNA (adenosine(37)-N6)-methyltransferase TrmM [Bacteroidetes bacterium]|nr:tRNA (adenosine(37)-N6)-methyltransferase TrmM [Bacteroidota bacterium]|tara:strand:+ start:114 stop:815 length:702 start_codon:yes stop_codon:yes gene_type:complete
MAFKFKQFSIEDDCSTMKVGTDAVLVGAWTNPSKHHKILDIGTGSGVIALMLAQKSEAQITALEIDENAAIQASENFSSSTWSEQLNIINDSLQSFSQKSNEKFDLIISNPPFFEDSLLSPVENKKNAKHTVLLSFEELLSACDTLLTELGTANFIIPYSGYARFKNLASLNKLHLKTILKIRPTPTKDYNRCILSFSRTHTDFIEEELCIRDSNSNYTSEYKELTKDYYLNF